MDQRRTADVAQVAGVFGPGRQREEVERQSVAAVAGLLGEALADQRLDRKSTRLNSSHNPASRMPSSA
jgi:hypothetical protein